MNIRGPIKATKMRYRLYADGTIIDQDTGSSVGYIINRDDLDEAWNTGGRAKQLLLKKYLNENNN